MPRILLKGSAYIMLNNSMQRSSPLCTAVLGSMTIALKAQKALAKQAIRAEAVKISRPVSNKGCIYGLKFDCALMGNVREALDSADIKVEEFLR